MARLDHRAGEVAERFRTAMLEGEAGGIGEVLAEDVRFYSPAFSDPTAGRVTVAGVLVVARQVYGEMRFGQTLAARRPR